jgi:hypothetical protein
MDAQRTPDELTAENELICEKLLGWSKAQWFGDWAGNWNRPDGGMCAGTPSFTHWAEAGLILDAFAKNDIAFDVYQDGEWSVGFYGKHTKCHTRASETGPVAIRAAALAYVRSLP